MTASAAPVPSSDSSWAPLRHPVFRALWIATVASSVGTWMHDTAATWLMTTLSPSTLLVALMQTATSLPMLFLALPAGALADIVDRRRLLIATQSWMLAAAALLGALTMAHVMTPGLLLALTFVLGLGTALNTPAWQAITPDLVPRPQLPAAIALGGVATNIARAVGPAIGGLLVAALGSGPVFLLNAVSFVAVLFVLHRWRQAPVDTVMPAERVLGAMRAGGRYLRHSPAVRAVLVRCSTFILGASALWALLPVLARHELGLGALGYGALLGSLGVGAIAGGAVLGKLRRRMSTDRLVVGATVLYAVATAVLAWVRIVPVLWVALFAAGIAWMTAMPIFNVATQHASPDWARARMLAVYVLAFMGGMAVGSAAWGVVAEHVGIAPALTAASAVLIAGLALTPRFKLAVWEGLDLTPSGHWRDPVTYGSVSDKAGPVLVTVEYRIAPADAAAFTEAMQQVAQLRRRDGAVSWGLYQDAGEAERYLETFVSESWGEHMRQHARATMTDKRIEARARRFHRGDAPPAVSHLVHAAVQRPHIWSSWLG